MLIKKFNKQPLKLPAIGQGMAADSWSEEQIKILQIGIDLGMNFIDTAEAYANGYSEEIVGKAIQGRRDKVIIGTKFSPEHSTYHEVINAAERSLRRLKTDYIDLYQMHWPNPSVPLYETLSAMKFLLKDGKVRCIGVCNLFLRGLKDVQKTLKEAKIISLQNEYNLFDRMVEEEMLPYCEKESIFFIAYSPLDQGRIVDGARNKKVLTDIAQKYNKTLAQVALNWLIDKDLVVVIPKAKNIQHLKENACACDFKLETEDMKTIDSLLKRRVIKVSPEKICVSMQGQGNRLVYKTLEEAIENKLERTPSPLELSKSIIKEKVIKPVRLIKTKNANGKYEYDLVEGRIRYWAWVIAYGNTPIPAYIREDWK